MIGVVEIEPKWVARARVFASSKLAVSKARKVSSESVAIMNFVGKLGEVGVAKALGLDPEFDINWTVGSGDSGVDLVAGEGKRVSVKASGWDNPRLIWPVTSSMKELQEAPVDVFALAAVGEGLVNVIGYVSRGDFIAQHQMAEPPVNLKKGTRYLPYEVVEQEGDRFWTSKETDNAA